MNQSERREYLIKALLREQPRYKNIDISKDVGEQKNILRFLVNVRMAALISEEFEKVQDDYLQEVNAGKGFVSLEYMDEVEPDLYIWQGDITRLKVGAIVNAANSGMTGC